MSSSTTPEAMESMLRQALDQARAQWKGCQLSDPDFMRFLAQKAPKTPEGILALHLVDLYLACACSLGDPAALQHFESAYFNELDAAHARIRAPVSREDLRQIVRERLFVAAGTERPKVADYSGQGELRAWFRVVVTRVLLNLVARSPREVALDSAMSMELSQSHQGPELKQFKEWYRQDFKAAFVDALGTLEPRERSVLRLQYIDQLSIEQIASVYAVHGATVSRWLTRARSRLRTALKKTLMKRLQLSRSELSSMLRLVRSQFDLSLRQYL